MKTNQLFSMVIAGVLAAGAAFAQEPTPAMGSCPTICGVMCGMMPGMMGAHKGEMMEWHQKMMEKMKVQDAELDKLVQDMNAATGDKKVDALAAIVNKVMEDRKAWHSEMEMRHNKMREWMQEKKAKMEGEMASPTPIPSPTATPTPTGKKAKKAH